MSSNIIVVLSLREQFYPKSIHHTYLFEKRKFTQFHPSSVTINLIRCSRNKRLQYTRKNNKRFFFLVSGFNTILVRKIKIKEFNM